MRHSGQLAREVRIPGFRPGRAPRRVLEAHFGPEIGRAQALEEAVPRYYAKAVRDNLLDVVNQPELELTLDGSEGPVAFDAVVEVRPLVSVAGYENLQIEIPSPIPTDEQIDARIDDTRRQFANIIEVDRPAAHGDRVTVDIEGSVDGVALPGLSAQDYLYELGSGGIVPEVDEYLTDCVAGDDVSFSAPHPTQPDMEIDFEITVGAVVGACAARTHRRMGRREHRARHDRRYAGSNCTAVALRPNHAGQHGAARRSPTRASGPG